MFLNEPPSELDSQATAKVRPNSTSRRSEARRMASIEARFGPAKDRGDLSVAALECLTYDSRLGQSSESDTVPE